MSANVLELVIPRRLESPNKTRGHHWRRRHHETKWWEALIRSAIGRMDELNAWSLVEKTETRGPDKRGKYRLFVVKRPEVRRVTVLRIVPSRRNFIKDEENLRFATKPLNDALSRLGLVYDDSRRWMEQPIPDEAVSPGVDRTVIRIERVNGQEKAIA